MAKKSKSMIGHDPLAWLKEDAEDAEITEVEEKPKAKKKAAKKTATKSGKSPGKSNSAAKKTATAEAVYEIQSVQDISSVMDLHEELKGLFKNEKVVLDGEKVERIDTASLQLLLSFIEEAKINNVNVVWRSPSDAISNSAKLLGMEDALQLNEAA